jgi:hypothetical protein
LNEIAAAPIKRVEISVAANLDEAALDGSFHRAVSSSAVDINFDTKSGDDTAAAVGWANDSANTFSEESRRFHIDITLSILTHRNKETNQQDNEIPTGASRDFATGWEGDVRCHAPPFETVSLSPYLRIMCLF